jgi:hypothetical protein
MRSVDQIPNAPGKALDGDIVGLAVTDSVVFIFIPLAIILLFADLLPLCVWVLKQFLNLLGMRHSITLLQWLCAGLALGVLGATVVLLPFSQLVYMYSEVFAALWQS